MKKTFLTLLASASLLATAHALEYEVVPDWLKLQEGKTKLGDMHGDIAISSKGEVYFSVQEPGAGVVVYSADGKFLRSLPKAPSDFHGFVIRKQADGEFIYGPRLGGQCIVKLTLDGETVLNIPASTIPDEFKNKNGNGKTSVALTGMDVAPNGDLYVTDGYASDYIHRFDHEGKYIQSFGGKKAPFNFKTVHKIVIDNRFQPPQILACDRANMRLVHFSLQGEWLGVVATDLRLPSALAIHGDYVAVGELNGRVTVLDKEAKVVARVGENTAPGVGTNQMKPEQWRPGFISSAHGVTFNEHGDIFVSEWNVYGRVQRFNLK